MTQKKKSSVVKDVFKVLLSAVISPVVLLLGLPILLISQIAPGWLGNVADVKMAIICACGTCLFVD